MYEKTEVLPPYHVRQVGYAGQEIIDPDGTIIAWTSDNWTAQVIAKLLCENAELMKTKCHPARQNSQDGTI